jgi:DNA-binding LacI/PurR family transcriptional regulator
MKTDILYRKVYNVLRAGIVNGTYPPGSRLPTEPELMEQFQVSRVTARQALMMLKGERLIVSIPAKGTFVAKTHAQWKGLTKKIIVVLTPDVDTGFFSKIIRGVEREACARGFHVLVHATNDLVAEEARFLKDLSAEVAGFVIAAAAIGARDSSGYQQIASQGVPFVFVDRALELGADDVVSDNMRGGYLATRHLLELGHTRIGVIVPRGCASYARRVEGYLQALAECGIASDPTLIVHPEEESPNGDNAEYFRQGSLLAQKLLALPAPPTAICILNNMAAVGALRYLQSQDIVVPDQMALVGYDGVDATGYVTPTITTVDQEPLQMGTLAAQMVLARIGGEVMPPQNISLPVTLCVRESSVPSSAERQTPPDRNRTHSAR